MKKAPPSFENCKPTLRGRQGSGRIWCWWKEPSCTEYHYWLPEAGCFKGDSLEGLLYYICVTFLFI